jgi:hypothetical protein
MNDEREMNRELVERWRRAGPMLAAVHAAELRALDEKFDYAGVDALLEMAAAASKRLPPSTTSGLVEQQRRFARLRS